MFTDYELGHMNEEYKISLNKAMIIHKRLSISIFFLVLSTIGIIIGLDFVSDDSLKWVVAIYGILFLIGASIYIIFSFKFGVKKPFYDIVVKKVVEKINYNLDLNLQYSSDKKIEFNHNKSSGIFSRFCRSKVRMHINGFSIEDRQFDLFDLTLITGNGKNQRTHLNGIYIVTSNKTNIIQQIRTHGSPHLKGVKYRLIEKDFQYKLFLDDESETFNQNKRYYDIFSSIMNDTMYKIAYMSVIKNETHFAIHKFKLYKHNKINSDNMTNLYEDILSLIKLVDKIGIKEF